MNYALDSSDDIQWLKDTHLKGVPLTLGYEEFRFAVLQGNEDCPYAVNLYKAQTPNFDDNYLRVKFIRDVVYCEVQEYSGKTDKPL